MHIGPGERDATRRANAHDPWNWALGVAGAICGFIAVPAVLETALTQSATDAFLLAGVLLLLVALGFVGSRGSTTAVPLKLITVLFGLAGSARAAIPVIQELRDEQALNDSIAGLLGQQSNESAIAVGSSLGYLAVILASSGPLIASLFVLRLKRVASTEGAPDRPTPVWNWSAGAVVVTAVLTGWWCVLFVASARAEPADPGMQPLSAGAWWVALVFAVATLMTGGGALLLRDHRRRRAIISLTMVTSIAAWGSTVIVMYHREAESNRELRADAEWLKAEWERREPESRQRAAERGEVFVVPDFIREPFEPLVIESDVRSGWWTEYLGLIGAAAPALWLRARPRDSAVPVAQDASSALE